MINLQLVALSADHIGIGAVQIPALHVRIQGAIVLATHGIAMVLQIALPPQQGQEGTPLHPLRGGDSGHFQQRRRQVDQLYQRLALQALRQPPWLR